MLRREPVYDPFEPPLPASQRQGVRDHPAEDPYRACAPPRDLKHLGMRDRALAEGDQPHLPEGATDRKGIPLCTGLLDYFPDALVEVAKLSKAGNDQHNPGEVLHWAKEKSTDEPDALLRHLLDRGTRDIDGRRHSVKLAWRALALLQRELDAERVTAAVKSRAHD